MLVNEKGAIKNGEELKPMSEFFKHVIKRFDFITKFVYETSERSKFNPIVLSLKSAIMKHATNYAINIITRRIIDDKYVVIDSSGKEDASIEEIDYHELVNREGNKKTSFAFKRMNKGALFIKLSSDSDSKAKTRGLWINLVISGITLGIFLYIFNVISLDFYNKEIIRLKYLKTTYQIIAEIHNVLYLVRETFWEIEYFTNNKYNLGFETYDEYWAHIRKNILKSGEEIAVVLEDSRLGMKNYYHERNVNLSYIVNYQNEVSIYLSLGDSLLTFIAHIFRYSNLYDYSEYIFDEDFFTYNAYQRIHPHLIEMSGNFTEEAYALAKTTNTTIILIIVLSSLAMVSIIIFAINSCIVYSSSKEIMSLLLCVPYNPIQEILDRCELFYQISTVDNNDETKLDSEQDEIFLEKHNLSKPQVRRYRNISILLPMVVLTYIIYIIGLFMFSTWNFLLDRSYKNEYKQMIVGMNSLMKLKSLFQIDLNFMMECLLYSLYPYMMTNSCIYYINGIDETYEILTEIEKIERTEFFFNNYISNDIEYIYYNDLCNNSFNITINLPKYNCSEFEHGILTHGLKSISVHYMELLREIALSKEKAIKLIGRRTTTDLYLMQNIIFKPFYDEITEILLYEKENANNKNVSLKWKITIIGIILVFILGFIIWILLIERIRNDVNYN